MKLGVVQLEHVAVSVADLERSVTFYRDRLGFTLLRVIEPRDDAKLGRITGISGARARIAHLTMGENLLELFEYTEPRGRPIPPDRQQADLGFIHMGFRTRDARGDYDQLTAAGVDFIGEPVEFRPGAWVAYFRGPDGEVCELRQDDRAPLPASVDSETRHQEGGNT